MRFGNIDIAPAYNPAILDTATWDERAAAEILAGLEPAVWDAIEADTPVVSPQITPYRGSAARHGESAFTLAGLADGQQCQNSRQPPQTNLPFVHG